MNEFELIEKYENEDSELGKLAQYLKRNNKMIQKLEAEMVKLRDRRAMRPLKHETAEMAFQICVNKIQDFRRKYGHYEGVN